MYGQANQAVAPRTAQSPGEAVAPGANAATEPHQPTVRLHIWLEAGDELFFGAGRAQLLMNVHNLGSLKKAAESMGMSYRAAWGKIRQSEEVLGVKLIAKRGTRRDGLQLTRFGTMLADMFQKWFRAVEEAAVERAADIFPFDVCCFDQRPDHDLDD